MEPGLARFDHAQFQFFEHHVAIHQRYRQPQQSLEFFSEHF